MELHEINNKLFRKIFDVAPDPILIIDKSGSIVLANKETENVFGYSVDDLLGKKIEILVPQRFRGNHVHYRGDFYRHPSVRPMGSGRDLFALRKDGSELPVEVSLSPMEIQSEILVIGIIRDISERKRVEGALKTANKELSRSNKELEEFAYIASHDLQEPLRSVAGSCQLLKRRYADKLDASAIEFIDFAVAGAKRMEELIIDLLSYSRVSIKAKEPTLTDMNKVLNNVLDNLRTATTDANATITSDVLPVLAIDEWQVYQLFQNLIANSLKFKSNDPPKIHIGSTQEEGRWHFSISDNGIGIDAKYFDRIFVVFKRLHSRDEYPGTGIGLASCKKIVERHGGEIWLESTVGIGTTFHFTLSP
jgi:PAS domain S-box-containing protein